MVTMYSSNVEGNMTKAETNAAKLLGRKGGKAKTEAKKAAARENGKRGGRPKDVAPSGHTENAVEQTTKALDKRLG